MSYVQVLLFLSGLCFLTIWLPNRSFCLQCSRAGDLFLAFNVQLNSENNKLLVFLTKSIQAKVKNALIISMAICIRLFSSLDRLLTTKLSQLNSSWECKKITTKNCLIIFSSSRSHCISAPRQPSAQQLSALATECPIVIPVPCHPKINPRVVARN